MSEHRHKFRWQRPAPGEPGIAWQVCESCTATGKSLPIAGHAEMLAARAERDALKAENEHLRAEIAVHIKALADANNPTVRDVLLFEALQGHFVDCPDCQGRGYHGIGNDGPCDTCSGDQKLDPRIVALKAENERLRAALEGVSLCGHNDDCLFCARKDFNAQRALAQPDDASGERVFAALAGSDEFIPRAHRE